MSLTNGLSGISIRRREGTRIHRDLPSASHPAEASFVEHPQKLGLKLKRHLRDLVEEERPAIRELETTDPLLDRPRERASLMSEDLTLHQLPRNCSRVDRDEGTLASGAKLVNRPRHELLAGAALAMDQHRSLAFREPLDELVDLPHLRTLAGEHTEPRVRLEVRGEAPGPEKEVVIPACLIEHRL